MQIKKSYYYSLFILLIFTTKVCKGQGCSLSVGAEIFNSSCETANGGLILTAGGGTPPYLYGLDSLATDENSLFDALPPGTYNIYATDQNGCSASSIVTIYPDSTATWLGGFGTDWNNPYNWSRGAVPSSCNNVAIGQFMEITISSDVTLNSLSLDSTSSLTVITGAHLTILH